LKSTRRRYCVAAIRAGVLDAPPSARQHGKRTVTMKQARQQLLRLCQSTNYGHTQDLVIKDSEPVLDPGAVVLLDIKLDAEERPRPELDNADFLLCAEAIRLMTLLDQITNGKVSKLEVRGGVPRIIFEHRISELEEGRRDERRHSEVACREAGWI